MGERHDEGPWQHLRRSHFSAPESIRLDMWWVGERQPGTTSPVEHASALENGVQTDLGTLGTADCAFAVTINSKDQIAGASYSNCDFEAPGRGFLYENGELVDLNNLVPPDSQLQVSEPETINDRGEIAGLGVDDSGNSRAFLLIPCDEDHSEVEGCDYDMVDAETAAQVSPALVNDTSAVESGAKIAPTGMMTRYGTSLARRTKVRRLATEINPPTTELWLEMWSQNAEMSGNASPHRIVVRRRDIEEALREASRK